MADALPKGTAPAISPKKSQDAALLADIDFAGADAGTKEIIIYIAQLRSIMRELAMEIHVSASEIENRLTSSRGGHRGQMDRLTAKRVVNELRKSAQHADAAGDQGIRFLNKYLEAFMDLIRPDKKRGGWKWREDGK